MLWFILGVLSMGVLAALWIRANAREEAEFERRLEELERGER